MIELTVKTLDAKNYSFSVEDETTVAEFKEILAGTVNVEASTQRIIYRGHVLRDAAKLKDLGVHGNVVHLVVKPPPPQPPPRSTSSTSPQHSHRSRGMEFLGAMRFPGPSSDGGFIPTTTQQTLAGSRLNIARRMLQRAENILYSLEHPPGRTTDQTCQVNAQDLASAGTESEAESNSTVSPPLLVPDSLPGTSTSEISVDVPEMKDSPDSASGATSSDENPIISSTVESLPASAGEEPVIEPGTSTSNNNNPRDRDEGLPLSEYSNVLDILNSVQERFAPFLADYNNFMREDPNVPVNDARNRQYSINRVAEILHHLGHTYHALSDIIVRVRNPTPRFLMCRPIVIQHSAIVQAGIPIQVEAQINFGPSHTTTPQAPGARNPNQASNAPTSTTNIGPTLIGFPIIPGGLRIERTTMAPRTGATATTTNTATTTAETPTADPGTPTANAPTSISLPTGPIIRGSSESARQMIERVQQSGLTNSINTSIIERMLSEDVDLMRLPRGNMSQENQNMFASLNNPNVEVFMEIAPESVTVDSIETSFISNDQQSADYIQGTLNTSPDLIQSIVQVATALMGRSNVNESPPSTTPSSTASESSSTTDTSTTPPGSARTNPFQTSNSQARTNTQTQPTTATHTRSTARPHVQFSQHTLSSFDPFLPCNSHHIRRRHNTSNTANNSQQSQSNDDEASVMGEDVRGQPVPAPRSALHILHNLTHNIIGSVRNAAASGRSDIPMSNIPTSSQNMSGSHASLAADVANLLMDYSNARIDHGSHSIVSDLMMFLLRHLNTSSLILLGQGNAEPLNQIRGPLRTFIMSRILQVDTAAAINETSIREGVRRILGELQPYIEGLSRLETRDNIDIVRSANALIRVRLINIITLLTSHTDCFKMAVDQFIIAYRQLCALVLTASRNGREDVVRVFQELATLYCNTPTTPIIQWPITNMTTVFRSLLLTLDVPQSDIQPYIMRFGDVIEPEPMQVGEDDVAMEASSSARGEPAAQSFVNRDVEMFSPSNEPQSQAWRSRVPPSWVPIITKDSQKQRKQNSQPPFSDAYLATLPTKRRKIIEDKKPPQGSSLPQIIAESVRRAVTSVNLDNNSPASVDAVVQAVSNDNTLQAAYHERLRSAVQAQLRNRDDFEPSQFPNANDYFMDYQQ